MAKLSAFSGIALSVRKNWKTYLQYALALFFILFAIRFFSRQRYEISNIRQVLHQASPGWLWGGIFLTLLYVVLQGQMYVYAFAAIDRKAGLKGCILLFLKRNFVSIFLPAGGITSLALFNQEISNRDIKKQHVQGASALYAIVGILSVILVAIPALCFSFSTDLADRRSWAALGTLLFFFLLLYLLYRDLRQKGACYRWLHQHISSFSQFMEVLGSQHLQRRALLLTIVTSIFIDIIGIGQLYCAMYALGMEPTLYLATMAYIVAVLLLIVSPFLRGIGAIDATIVYMLLKAGYTPAQSLTATVLFRFFEFWLPLLLGLGSFLVKINQFLVRIIPAAFLLGLGVIDISSALTPPIHERLLLVHEFFSLKTIHTSNYFVLMAGLFLIMNAFLLLRGTLRIPDRHLPLLHLHHRQPAEII